MTPRDTLAAPVAAEIVGPRRAVLLPRVLAEASRRDPGDPASPSVVRVVPRERLVARRVYVAVDAAGWAVYVGSTSDEMRRIHEHEARLGELGRGPLTWVWLPAQDAYRCEEGLIRVLEPTALPVRGRAPTSDQWRAMRAAGLGV